MTLSTLAIALRCPRCSAAPHVPCISVGRVMCQARINEAARITRADNQKARTL